MRAVFKDDHAILTTLDRLIWEVERKQRLVDFIELTPPEWDLFLSELRDATAFPSGYGIQADGSKQAIYRGYRIVRKEPTP